jgi:hypothetical protein
VPIEPESSGEGIGHPVPELARQPH